MSDAELVHIASLMTTYNFQIVQLPDNLKCAQCKLVLKDACQVPCGCKFCGICIDDMMTRGVEFCPGDSVDCGKSRLSRFVPHYEANKKVSELPVKCPHDGCLHKCQLANIEEHLRECPRKIEECPFRELGCTQNQLAAEDMSRHLQHENRRHSQILIGLIANINNEIETLKQRDEASRKEIEALKQELVLKDGQIRSIMDQIIHVQNENKLIKEEKEDLAGRVRILSEKIDVETAERRENDELDSARVIEHVDREIAAVTGLIGSNKDELTTEIQSVRSIIGTLNQDIQYIETVKSQIQSIQKLVGLGQIDAHCLWLIDDSVAMTTWYGVDRESEYFSGAVHPYKYRLRSWNTTDSVQATFCIDLFIHAGPSDEHLRWPFKALVIVTVVDKVQCENYSSISRECQIDKPPGNQCSWSEPFMFPHSDLTTAGLNLTNGVKVTCMIFPPGY